MSSPFLSPIACLVLICLAAYADTKASDDQSDRTKGHASKKPQTARPAGQAKPRSQIVQRPKQASSANAAKPGHGVDGPSSAAAKSPLLEIAPSVRPQPVRSPRPAQTAAPPLSNVRHRSPDPAVIAGSASLAIRNTGAINGSQIHPKP